MGANSKRNQRILALVAQERLSYELIAGMFGCSRNVVAGVVWRNRHPGVTRVCSPKGNGPNKTGTGYRPHSYEPELTSLNTR